MGFALLKWYLDGSNRIKNNTAPDLEEEDTFEYEIEHITEEYRVEKKTLGERLGYDKTYYFWLIVKELQMPQHYSKLSKKNS